MTPSRSAVRQVIRPSIVLIAAVSENGVIGRANALPWRLKSDMRHFRALTMGKPVVMGRKTYLSIGKPLPGRTNIVVSRDPAFAVAGVLVAGTLTAALEAARGDVLRRGTSETAIIGGAELYAQAMPVADRLEITRVHADIRGDAMFPSVDPAVWREVARKEQAAGPGDDADMTFITYRPAGAGGGSESSAL
ncbi:MAG: dihydrofolate reductase [Rhizobiales bacterium]|nr:dihydrofolate reductase [Hyphomicrobiales bacterium]